MLLLLLAILLYINGAAAFPQALTQSSYVIPLCLCHSCFILFLSLWHRQVRRVSPSVKCSLLHSSLKAPCSSSMVILLLYLSSASCLPSNKHHPRLAIPLVIWKRTGDQWQGCCHGTVYSCRVEFCCKARESWVCLPPRTAVVISAVWSLVQLNVIWWWWTLVSNSAMGNTNQ